MYNVLITGANGFIGRALCRRLLTEGWEVRGAIRSFEKKHLLPQGINAVKIGNIDAHTEWETAVCGIDTIVHLAARVHMMDNISSASINAFRNINVTGTKRLVQIAEFKKVRRFVYISSIKVNGKGTTTWNQKSETRDQKAEMKVVFSEMDIPDPRDPYGISKWEAEKILNKIAKESEMEIVILRPPLVYGPQVKANFLSLLKVIKSGIPLPLASVHNNLSLIYVENLVDAIVTCIDHPRAAGNTYLVSDGEDVSIAELIRRISFALGRPARLFPFPTDLLKMAGIITGRGTAMDSLLKSLTIDCSKINRELDWQAPFSMDQGLRETARWYKKK